MSVTSEVISVTQSQLLSSWMSCTGGVLRNKLLIDNTIYLYVQVCLQCSMYGCASFETVAM